MLGDSAFEGDTADAGFWSKEAFDRHLAIAPPSLLAVGTARQDGEVKVVVDVLSERPPLELDAGDRVQEVSLDLRRGRLMLDESLGYWAGEDDGDQAQASAPNVPLPPGRYRLRLHCGGQDTLDEDHYWLALWPAAGDTPFRQYKPVPSPPPAATT
jgi:hypothetical protein